MRVVFVSIALIYIPSLTASFNSGLASNTLKVKEKIKKNEVMVLNTLTLKFEFDLSKISKYDICFPMD